MTAALKEVVKELRDDYHELMVALCAERDRRVAAEVQVAMLTHQVEAWRVGEEPIPTAQLARMYEARPPRHGPPVIIRAARA